MAVTDHLDGLNDQRLKPRMLRSLVRDHLPDEKRPSPSPAELSSVLSYVKTHGLLSESHPHVSDRKQIDGWRSAVDAWVERLLLLVSSNMPDKCWAGICLLGVTCEECSSDRFLASYSVWFQKLLSNIQPPSSTHFVKVASCASLADLFTRLAYFSNSKKDATSLAGKLIQPVLQLLNEDGSEAVWEGAVDLLCTLLTYFPSSMHRLHDNAEVVLVSKIMSAKCNANMSKKFACCLALLPKVRGDEDSWCLMMQKILIVLNTLLSDAFQGLEEEAKSSEIMRLLVPPGKEPPPPLGGQPMSGVSSEQAIKRLRELLAPRVSALMQCCCMMLTNPYPVQVTVPVRPLLALVGRVLLVDGSLHDSLLPFATAMQQEILCFELPALHLDSLELLIAIVKGVRSQLIPHAANIVRLLTEYFRRTTLPSIRIKVYSIVQILLISMGVGMALYLAQEVIDNASLDLNDCPGGGVMPSNTFSSKVASEVLMQSSNRKRKHVFGSPTKLTNGIALEVDAESRKLVAPVSVKIAALRALEALLTVGGSLRSECWRSNVDLLLITVATNACDAGWANERKCSTLMEESTSSRAELQLAALQALLASLLSSAHVRPPYLSQGLELFRRGKQESGTKLAAFCAHALLALEVLIHPRALPLADFPVGKSSTFDEGFIGGKKPYMPSFSRGDPDLDDDDNDEDLYNSLLENDEETGVDVGNLNTLKATTDDHLVHGQMEDDSLGEKHLGINSASPHEVAEGNQLPSSTDIEMQCLDRDENTVVSNPEPNSSEGVSSPAEAAIAPADVASRDEMDTGKGDLVSCNASNLDNDAGDDSKSVAEYSKGKGMSLDSDSDSLASLPDIVDADPDSD